MNSRLTYLKVDHEYYKSNAVSLQLVAHQFVCSYQVTAIELIGLLST